MWQSSAAGRVLTTHSLIDVCVCVWGGGAVPTFRSGSRSPSPPRTLISPTTSMACASASPSPVHTTCYVALRSPAPEPLLPLLSAAAGSTRMWRRAPAACCLLPAACCLLPAACCLLMTMPNTDGGGGPDGSAEGYPQVVCLVEVDDPALPAPLNKFRPPSPPTRPLPAPTHSGGGWWLVAGVF
jgi:hypothetical protein